MREGLTGCTQNMDYKWMVDENREISKVIAIAEGVSDKHLEKINKLLKKDKIEIITPKEIIKGILEYLNEHENLKIQHEALRLIQIMRRANSF